MKISYDMTNYRNEIILPVGLIILASMLAADLLLPVWIRNYGILHTLAELIGVIIAACSFLVIWFSARLEKTNLLLGLGFLAAAVFDSFHLLSLNYSPAGYFGLGVLYWVLGRFMEALFLILSTTVLAQRLRNKYLALLTLIITVATGVFVYNYFHLFPVLFTSEGFTPAKRLTEYVIIAMYLVFLYRLLKGYFSSIIQRDHMVKAILIAISTEICFILFIGIGVDFFNLLGHLLRAAFYFYLLRAVVEGQIIYAFNLLDSSNQKFSKAFYDNQTPMVITRMADGLIIEANYQFLKEFGFGSEELVGQRIADKLLLRPAECKQLTQDILKSGIVREKEYIFKRRNGELCNVILSATQIEIAQEVCMLASFKDITKHKKAEAALRQSKKLFNQLFHSIPLPMVIMAVKDRRVEEVNEAFKQFHKIAAEQTERIADICSCLRLDDIFTEVRQNGSVSNKEFSCQLTDGSIKTVLLSAVPIIWEGEECILLISSDITEIRSYQKEMMRLENLNIMGQMAASIAHEIRNPMTCIKGFLQLFEKKERFEDEKESIALMIEELDRVNEIITTYLSMAKMNVINLKVQNMNNIIVNLFPLIMADAMKNNVNIKLNIQEVSDIIIDEGELKQGFLNLVRNGIEAMPNGGILTINTYQDTNGVNLIVEDQGQGIPPEIREKIGTPFLTTKENGTGLGVALCYSIAERCGAEITFESGPKGTSFKLTFPVAA